jgi:hypothetical protein
MAEPTAPTPWDSRPSARPPSSRRSTSPSWHSYPSSALLQRPAWAPLTSAFP